MTPQEMVRQEARLIILRALAGEPDGRLNSSLLQSTLEAFGLTRSREWVHEELAWLADVAAIAVQDIASVRVASLTDKGREHVERRRVIEGIKRPSFGG
ncbi:MAG: hypothetical protein JNM13_15705 [Hyphomicrobiaceae bacterium]|nr:hypothetical protein [Hyphomicrobiaceae bacterium]